MESTQKDELPTLYAERIELADGRYLIYYTFEESPVDDAVAEENGDN